MSLLRRSERNGQGMQKMEEIIKCQEEACGI